MLVERGGKTKLDERLDALTNRDTGEIWISPEIARQILLDSLLAEYRNRISQLPESLRRVNPKVEVLAEIAKQGEGVFDFTKSLSEFQEARTKSRRPLEERPNVYKYKPRQAEL